jgi:hypothetical protein
MLAAAFAAGASCYAFYAMQPYLLELFGNPEAYSIAAIGATGSFWVAVVVPVIWAIVFAAVVPIRQASLNGIMPSEQRATVL